MGALAFMVKNAGFSRWWIVAGALLTAATGVLDALIIPLALDQQFGQLVVMVAARFILDNTETFTSQGLAKLAGIEFGRSLHGYLQKVRGSPAGLSKLDQDFRKAFDAIERTFYSSVATLASVVTLICVIAVKLGPVAGVVSAGLFVCAGVLVWLLVRQRRLMTVALTDLEDEAEERRAEMFDARSHFEVHGLLSLRQKEYDELSSTLGRMTVKSAAVLALISASLYLSMHIMLIGVAATAESAILGLLVAHIFRARAAVIAMHVHLRTAQTLAIDLDRLSRASGRPDELDTEETLIKQSVQPTHEERTGEYVRLEGPIEFKGVSLNTDRPIIRDFDLVMPMGTMRILCGPSGSGKTTLLRALLGFEVPTHGEVRIGGQIPTEQNLLRDVAVCFVKAHIGPKKIRDELRSVIPGLEQEIDDEALKDALYFGQLGHLEGRLSKRARRYISSDGEKQRFGWALLYLKVLAGARFLILDEPLAHVDEHCRARLMTGLHRLQSELHDLTILVVSHEPRSSLAEMGHRGWTTVTLEPVRNDDGTFGGYTNYRSPS